MFQGSFPFAWLALYVMVYDTRVPMPKLQANPIFRGLQLTVPGSTEVEGASLTFLGSTGELEGLLSLLGDST